MDVEKLVQTDRRQTVNASRELIAAADLNHYSARVR